VKALVAADMEGIAGIEDYADCLPSHPAAYVRGRRLMTDEVLAAVESLRAAGVDEVTVGDWHMVGTNLERERIPDGVAVRPIADLALAVEEPSFREAAGGHPPDAVVLVGHHAKTQSPLGFCSHTFIWEMEVELGGASLSETQVYAQGLAAEGIPVLAASGDRRLLEELEPGELGGARLVETKVGEGRARARSIPVDEARAKLSTAVREALAEPLEPPRARKYPAELRISVSGIEIARTTVDEPGALLTAVAAAFRSSGAAREYRRLARLLPAGHDSALRSLQRRFGSLVATPAIRAKERRWLAS
jgi:D-aminopeptidase